jgi:S1 RNA binding domain protein
MLIEVGKIVEGKVTGITNFGAFIQLNEGKTGLVHISEVAIEYVKDIKNHLKQGQVVKVKVLSIDNKGKVSLSIKKALQDEGQVAQKKVSTKPMDIDWSAAKNDVDLNFEDKLSKFKQDSDERIQTLKKNFETKRGGGSYKKSAYLY